MAQRLSFVLGGAVLLVTAIVGFVLWRDADVLGIRSQTRVLAPTSGAPTTPRAAVEYFQCNRCHVIDGVEPHSARLNENCVTCHQAIQQGRLDRWYGDSTSAWKDNIRHLVRTPSLAGLKDRVKREWLIEWLQRPHVIRPLYGATMPKLKIGRAEAELLADFFEVSPTPVAGTTMGSAVRGRAVYERRDCEGCHFRGDAPRVRFGDLQIFATSNRRRAPDLRFVRERMSVAQARAWLKDPKALLPDTEMPNFELTPGDTEDLLAYLFEEPPPPTPRMVRWPVRLDRVVKTEEVQKILSHHLCFHCHSDADRPGDQGPGNSGGFGYAGVELALATEEGILRGVRRDGKFQGLPDRVPGGMPRLVASLLARQAEVDGIYEGPVLGMPMGFPPLADAEVDLIFTWVEQNALDH